ncbi:MAG: PKD domain-containing protein, partial [Ginsengibacter sp.]
MKKITLILSLFLFAIPYCEAHHIVGGEMIYQYLGKGSAVNTSKYLITLKIFRDQNVPTNTAQMPSEVYIGIYDNDNGKQFNGPYPYFIVQKNSESTVKINSFPPCMTNAPNLNYHVGIFQFTVDLPDNEKGYTAAYQTCCRVDDIENITNFNGSSTGSTFTCTIPSNKYMDSSPDFSTSIDVICAGKPFQLFYEATDADKDSLVYSFGAAYDGGNFRDDKNANPSPPPYNSVNYINGFNESGPLGTGATIDTKTGIISGIAPPIGKYVLEVSVLSYRKGVLLNEHRKDFIVNVTNCDFAGAQLNPRPVVCDSFNVVFQNDNTSSLNTTFDWDFGDVKSGPNNTSKLKSPSHVYTDTGVFVYKLIVNRGQNCSDSTTQVLKMYPGFYPAFNIDGKCINSAILFSDKTTTNFGSVNSWSWNFGDASSTSDSSNAKNSNYVYTQPGNYEVQLTAGNSKGCSKTVSKTVPIKAQPDFSLSDDTLICSIDTLQLTAIGNGNISWTPDYNINNTNSFTPLVSPKKPTVYYATLNESRGCIGTDSVFVNVVNRVSLSLTPDTTICLTDTIQLNPVSNGLHYLWTASDNSVSDTAKYPQVTPAQNTTYQLVSSIGKCNTAANIRVKAVPYPQARAVDDTTICFGNTIQLQASGGSIYHWTPSTFLNNPDIRNPIVSPSESVNYLLQVNDVLGCPKPAFATVNLTVEKLVADAGPADTAIVVNQPLQLNGTGAQFYFWSPSTGLNNPTINNPVALLTESQKYTLQVKSLAGCTAEDSINVMVYKVLPDLYVPDAFTPNGDGRNDAFRPIPIGIKELYFFKVYNRRGEL